MKWPLFTSLLIMTLIWPVLGGASPTAAEKFAQGISFYKTKDYQKAKESFAEALSLDPDSPSTLYNLALSESQLGLKGWALGHLRKALSLDPTYQEAEHTYTLWASRVDRPFSAKETSNWELLRSHFLRTVSGNLCLGLAAAFFFLANWLVMGYWGKRRTALLQEQALPPLPFVGFFFAAFFALALFLSGAKLLDFLSPRATVVQDKTEVKSGPMGESATLFELPEGSEVILGSLANGWVQITYPGGMTGWTLRERLFPSSGKQPW